MNSLRILAFFVMLAIAATPASPQSVSQESFELVGAGSKPVTITLEALAALSQIEQDVTFKTSKGVSMGHYKGPLLWDVVKVSKALDGLDHNEELSKTLMVTASDDYQIAFSIGELSPEFGNALVLLALEVDGKVLADGFRIVVQGDKRGARAIHNIVKMEIR